LIFDWIRTDAAHLTLKSVKAFPALYNRKSKIKNQKFLANGWPTPAAPFLKKGSNSIGFRLRGPCLESAGKAFASRTGVAGLVFNHRSQAQIRC
jgi:hypothetical protein